MKALRLVFPGVKQVLGHRDTSPDLNGDGELSQEEFVEYTIKEARAKAENTFNGFDTDHNGSLSEEEYLAALQKMMRRLAEQIKSSVQNMSETE